MEREVIVNDHREMYETGNQKKERQREQRVYSGEVELLGFQTKIYNFPLVPSFTEKYIVFNLRN